MSPLDEIHHYGPVTALKMLSTGMVLAGYGPFLRLFSRTQTGFHEVWRKRIFKRNKIHAIAVSADETRLVLAGSRSFCISDFAGIEKSTFVEKGINEWIIAAEFVHDHVLLLNSHNEVLRISTENGNYFVVEKVSCREKSILYSGSIQRCSDGRVLVAAGTVMSGVLVWDVSSREISHTLTDHEGSIFQAKIDPQGKLLVTCSDDRSIKLYDLATGAVLATGWGHGSRIWSLSFAISGNSVSIFSTGEDCTARFWTYRGTSELEQVACFPNCHEGKHIWSGDVSKRDPGQFVTGGADGKIRLLDLASACQTPNVLSLDQIPEFSPRPKECIKHFAEVAIAGGFFVLTSLGNSFFHCTKFGWSHVDLGVHRETFSRALATSIYAANMVKLFAPNGAVLTLQFSETAASAIDQTFQPPRSPNQKIINVLTADTPHGAVALSVDPNRGQPFLLQTFVLGTTHSTATLLERPDPRVFSPTSVHYVSQANWLFVGSRHGNLAMYDLAQGSPEPRVFWKICPGDTITSISCIQAGVDEFIGLFTVRDGVYMVIKFTPTTHSVLMGNKFPRGNLEGGYVREQQLFLYGFRSSSFFLWNETKQVEVAQAFCAGAHREWRFLQHKTSLFNFLSKDGLHSRLIHPDSVLLSPGTHGREIRSVALYAGRQLYIASASEDASVKFGTVSEDGHVHYSVTMRNHVSGLQKVAFLSDQLAISSAANEELLLWSISSEIPGNLAVTEQARLPVQGENPDLRIMDFSAIKTDDGFLLAAIYSNSQIKMFQYSQNFRLLAQHSYSTVCLLNVELLAFENRLFVAVGATDGYLTVWEWGSMQDFGAPLVRQQLHQSGIKAMHVAKTDSGFRIVTGGDDNSLLVCTLSISNHVLLHTASFVEKAASATITGIAAFGRDHVLVTSVDQIVRIWNYAADLVCVSSSYTTVADTGCCASVQTQKGLLGFVAGAGLSVFQGPAESS